MMSSGWLKRGSVTMMTALLAVPLVVLTGAAVDLARVWLVKYRLQMSLDAGVLVAGKIITTKGPTADTTDAKNLFWANWGAPNPATAGYMRAVATTPQLTLGATGAVTMTGSATIQPALIGIIGIGQITVNASSTAQTAAAGLEVALVLDNTGSMDTNNSIGALRTAAQTLVGILYGSADTQPHLWVSVVPFAAAVNIGNQHTGWLAPGSLVTSAFAPSTWMGCVMARSSHTYATDGDDSTDTPPGAGHWFKPFLYPSTYHMYPTSAGIAYGSGNNRGTWWYPGDNEWRATTWTATGNEPDRSNNAVGPNLDCPSLPILPETASKTTVLTWLDSNHMVAIYRGGTFINLGLQAGWWSISPNWQGLWGTPPDPQLGALPLAYGTPYMKKAIVLMTDGTNNWNDWNCGVPGQQPPQVTVPPSTTCPWTTKPPTVVPAIPAWTADGDTDFAAYGRLKSNIGNLPTTNPTATLNNLMSAMCTTIKSHGITIYTVLFNNSDGPTQTLFQQCASASNDYYYSPTQAALQAAFTQIGNDLSNLRLSQ